MDFLPSIIARLATTPGAMNDIDDAECIEGYWDGRANAPCPGDNRSNSYVQGWWTGMRDSGHRNYHPVDADCVAAYRKDEQLKREAAFKTAERKL